MATETMTLTVSDDDGYFALVYPGPDGADVSLSLDLYRQADVFTALYRDHPGLDGRDAYYQKLHAHLDALGLPPRSDRNASRLVERVYGRVDELLAADRAKAAPSTAPVE